MTIKEITEINDRIDAIIRKFPLNWYGFIAAAKEVSAAVGYVGEKSPETENSIINKLDEYFKELEIFIFEFPREFSYKLLDNLLQITKDLGRPDHKWESQFGYLFLKACNNSSDGLNLLKQKLDAKFQTQPEIEADFNQQINGEIKFVGHKILLLRKLGIVDFLRKRYYDQTIPEHTGNEQDFANLLSEITGIKAATIKKGISNNPSENGDVNSKPANTAVDSFLIKVAITPDLIK